MIAPPARVTPGGAIGVSEDRPRLFDNRWMHAGRRKRGSSTMAGGRTRFSHEITRLPGGGVVRSPSHSRGLACTWSRSAIAARPTVSREVAGSSPVGFVNLQCRRGGMHTRDAQNVVGHVPLRVRLPPAVSDETEIEDCRLQIEGRQTRCCCSIFNLQSAIFNSLSRSSGRVAEAPVFQTG